MAPDPQQSSTRVPPASAARPAVGRLRPYRPGKPLDELERELGITDSIKLASNENPLGPSPRALEAIELAAREVRLYPDNECHDLVTGLAAHWGVERETLFVDRGSTGVMRQLALAYLQPGDECVMGDPSFMVYEFSTVLMGATPVKVPLTADCTHDLDAMADAITDRTKLVFIANPDNPHGSMVTHDTLARFLARVPPHVLVVADEAYYEYAVQRDDYPDTLALWRGGAPVMMLRTFSKVYALAGLRVGYAIAQPEILRPMFQVREPFHITNIAQAAALASLSDPEQVARARAVNAAGLQVLQAGFDRLGLRHLPTAANFVFVEVGRPGREVYDALLRTGVIVRPGDIFDRPNWLRVTVGTPEQCARLIEALGTVL